MCECRKPRAASCGVRLMEPKAHSGEEPEERSICSWPSLGVLSQGRVACYEAGTRKELVGRGPAQEVKAAQVKRAGA